MSGKYATSDTDGKYSSDPDEKVMRFYKLMISK
jgi:hypothetical protein